MRFNVTLSLLTACIITPILCGNVLAGPKLFQKNLETLPHTKARPDEIIISLKKGLYKDQVSHVNARHKTRTLAFGHKDSFARLRVPAGKSIDETLEELKKDPDIEYAEPNYRYHALMTPNDSFFSLQWNLDYSSGGGINMRPTWDVTTGSAAVIVAIVDSGVAYENYDAYYKADDLASTTFVQGYDFVNKDNHPNDDNSHGTHLAGTIAQSTNNSIGTAGIAFSTAIMPVKVLDNEGYGEITDIVDGIYYAVDHGADVINLSLGSPEESLTLRNALIYAYNQGVTVICASGNDYENGNPVFYPAAYSNYCISVGATRIDKTHAYYSNTGSYVNIVAPGGDANVDQNGDDYMDGILQETINPLTLDPTDLDYWLFEGTSVATAHVSGVAALLIAKGAKGPSQVKEALDKTAIDLGSAGWDEIYGWGLVDAYAALQYAQRFSRDVALTGVSVAAAAVKGTLLTVTLTVKNLGDYSETITVNMTDTTDTRQIGQSTVYLASGGSTNVSFIWNTASASIQMHTLKGEISVTAESTTDNNTLSFGVNIQNIVYDVAVSAIDVPTQVTQGEIVPITVTADNQGSSAANLTISLNDQTDGLAIGAAQTVTVDAGGSTQVTFNWDTTAVSVGDHNIQASVIAISGETDTADNTMTMPVTVEASPRVSIGLADPQPDGDTTYIEVNYTGILQESADGINWTDLSPQPASPWEIRADQDVRLFRAR